TGEVCLTLPDTMPIRPGESIADMLSLYTFTALADTMHIVVLKAGKESRVVSLSQCRQVPIEPGDCITVSPMAQRKQLFTIRVSGEVARPGVYTLWTSDNDKNTVSSALAVAGGITTFGDRRRTYVVRRGIVNRTRQKTIIESSKSLRPQINYGMIRLLESNDFSILHGNDETVHLEDKDEVVVPRIENSVYVSGQVRNPGAFHFIPEKNSDYYISRAGGLAHSGDKKNIRVLTLYGDAFQLREKKNIEPGDIITIPEKEEQPWIQQWLPLLQLVSSTLSIGLALYTITTD
ncbi:MAG: SLBB domain-containing protein, partial [Chitinivibrionales bacterium]|nr:SLBB domain-containing protein [Chitinivibrionales bacterium]